ncbi:MAG: four helix bundle protein [Candidatus Moranbacteria bacterium]|nr:four helix bundle protein [Candidatus Moranbacteria bacterium]MDD5652337.1 four helix bundle protein [Candidatus Moranbacteria bacterium]
MKNKIEKFTDLIAWKENHELTLIVYDVTKKFPEEEKFGLTNQMRRCAVSITSNVAEGFSRSTPKDKNSFFFRALGSVTELQNQLLLSKDLKYIKDEDFQVCAEKSVRAHKLINGLIKSNNKRVASKK